MQLCFVKWIRAYWNENWDHQYYYIQMGSSDQMVTILTTANEYEKISVC